MDIRPDTSAASPHFHHHRDPITHAPDFHPLGTGVGAAAGGIAAGAAAGSLAGPIGMLLGAAAGAVAGGLAGKAVARSIDVEEEDAYWREFISHDPYVGHSEGHRDPRDDELVGQAAGAADGPAEVRADGDARPEAIGRRAGAAPDGASPLDRAGPT